MTSWQRQDFAAAPQGHALATEWGDSTFLAWEELNSWRVQRIDESGFETPVVQMDSFEDVRDQVEKAKEAYAPAFKETKHSRYLRAGAGALGGTVAGMLLGGLPGILMKHTALATVGAQVGGVVGAATGAILADRLREENPESDIAELKSKLLR